MHHASGAPGGLESWETDVIRHEVQSFLRTRDFRWSDRDDLFQECAEHWIKTRPGYREARGASRQTFMKAVLRNKLQDLWRAERTESRRGHLEAESLDEAAFERDNDEETRVEFMPDHHEPIADVASTAMDIARASAMLSPRQRRVFDALLRDYSIDSIARAECANRDTIYQDRKRIQEACEDVDLAPRTDPTKRRPRS